MLRRQLLFPFWALTFGSVLGGIFFSEMAFAKSVKLKWEEIEGATRYELQVHSDNGIVVHRRLKDPKWKGELEPGTYYYEVRAIDEVQRPGVWTEPKPLVVMPPATQPKYPPDGTKLKFYNPNLSIPLSWDPIPGVKHYSVEVKRDGVLVSKTVVSGTEFELKNLTGGKYSWKINAVLEAGAKVPAAIRGKKWESEGGSEGEFKVEQKILELPYLVEPLGVDPPPSDGKVKLRWKDVDGAELYEVYLKKDGKELGEAKRFKSKNNSFVFQVAGEGSYTWGVRALANLDGKQIAQAVGPESSGHFKLDRNAVFKGDLGYIAFSTMFAPYTYQIQSPLYGLQGDTQSVATVMRLSGEYLPHPQWAIGGGLDYASFTLAQTNFSRSAFEVQVKYRMKLGSQKYGWYFSPKIGAEMRQYNQIIPSDITDFTSSLKSNSIYTLGAAIGFDLRKQFSESFSLGIKGSYFKPLMLMSGAPSGSQLGGSASTRNISFGIQGLYWLNKTWGLGLGGFFENRSIGFTVPNSTGQESITMDGSYFFGSVIYRIWK